MAATYTEITTTTGIEMIPEVWSQEMVVEREANLVAAKCVKRFDAEVKNFGDIIWIPEVTDLHVHAVTEGEAVTYQANTESSVHIDIDKYYEVSFLVHDKFAAQTKYRYAQEMAKKAGYALAGQIDTDILALYASAGTSIGDGSTDITKEHILEAIRTLDGANVPSSDRHFIVDEYGKEDLFNEDDFVLYTATGQAAPAVTGARQAGEFGELYGVKVHVSTNVPVEASSPEIIHGLFFHRDGIGLAVQKNIKTETQRKAELLADLWVSQALYGVAVLRADHIIDFHYEQA
jgi:N4-gp56 family major capsid protein